MQRPVSATVFGILNLVFAAFGLFGLLATVTLLSTAADTHNPVARAMLDNPTFALWIKIGLPLGLIALLVLLVAGIGLLRLKEWARKLSIGYAIYAIVMGVVGMLMNLLFVVRPMLAQAQQQGPENAAAMAGAFGGVMGGCIGMIYPILLLIFLTRPKLVAAFQAPPESSLPPDSPAL